jgi:hypothetical protein
MQYKEQGLDIFPGHDWLPLDHKDHVGAFKCGAAGKIQKLTKLRSRRTSRAFRNII